MHISNRIFKSLFGTSQELWIKFTNIYKINMYDIHFCVNHILYGWIYFNENPLRWPHNKIGITIVKVYNTVQSYNSINVQPV